MLDDIKKLDPVEIVLLGDHLDCGGIFSSHARSYTNEMTESYDEDVKGANWLLDGIQRAAPRATTIDYLEGNHEQRVERWAASTFTSHKDATNLVGVFGPEAVLKLAERGIKYYKRSEQYMGISIPGAIKRGKCFFVHGVSAAKHAAHVHLSLFGASVVFGHVHRSQSAIGRTVTSDALGAWCPGTLAKIQPLYAHTRPTDWTHGYAVQFIRPSGRFMHVQVPIVRGESLLMDVARRVA